MEPSIIAEQSTATAALTLEVDQRIAAPSPIAPESSKNDHHGMEINFNVIGDKRKELVAAIGAFLDIKPKYTAAPKYSFIIGDYEVSRYGILTGPENPQLIGMLNAHGFTAE